MTFSGVYQSVNMSAEDNITVGCLQSDTHTHTQ